MENLYHFATFKKSSSWLAGPPRKILFFFKLKKRKKDKGKQTNKPMKILSPTRKRDIRDRSWAKRVKERDNNQCIICGHKERLNAHHLIPAEIEALRLSLINGVSLCPSHHRFNRQISAHQNPIEFHLWMQENRKEQLEELIKQWQEVKQNS